jgi:hypothetical protein
MLCSSDLPRECLVKKLDLAILFLPARPLRPFLLPHKCTCYTAPAAQRALLKECSCPLFQELISSILIPN